MGYTFTSIRAFSLLFGFDVLVYMVTLILKVSWVSDICCRILIYAYKNVLVTNNLIFFFFLWISWSHKWAVWGIKGGMRDGRSFPLGIGSDINGNVPLKILGGAAVVIKKLFRSTYMTTVALVFCLFCLMMFSSAWNCHWSVINDPFLFSTGQIRQDVESDVCDLFWRKMFGCARIRDISEDEHHGRSNEKGNNLQLDWVINLA